MDKLKVSIIIPCRNEEAFIHECITSVLAFNDPDNIVHEICVIDGMSTDNTKKIITEFFLSNPRIKLLNNPGIHQASALNIGIRKSTGNYILRLDAHAVYPKNYLYLCQQTAVRTDADNVGGIVIPKARNNHYCANLVQALTTHKFGVGNSGFRTGMKAGSADTVPYGFFKKSIFDTIGLFDERLVRAQDYEFNRRLIKSGGTVWLNPEIQVAYYNQPTFWLFIKKQLFHEAPYNAYMWYLAPYTFAYRHAVTGVFFLGILTGSILSFYFNWLKWSFFVVIALYLALAIFSSIQQAFRYKNIIHLITLPVSFFLFHFFHGLGLVLGIINLLLGRSPVQLHTEPWEGAGRIRAFQADVSLDV